MAGLPGYARQAQYRTAFRVAGVVLMGAAIVCGVVALVEFLTLDDFEDPQRFWLFFVAIPLFFVGGVCLQAGFGGAAARYAAGETMPVVRDSAAYLSDGEGVAGVGRTVDDERPAGTGPYCSACGVRNDAEARFCDACGAGLG